jgi:amino acid transporter
MVMLGVKTTARFQRIITVVQIAGMLFFAIGAIVKGLQHPINPPSWSWWSPIGPNGWHSFVNGALVVMFFYWGWEVTANLSEETVDRRRTPGLSGLLGMIVILALFLTSAFGVQLLMSQSAIADSASDLLVGMANAIVPGPWGALVAGIVVVISAVGSLQTTLVSGSRTIYSMGRDRVLAPSLGELNARFLTPWNATIAVGVVSIALFGFAATSPSVNAILNESIAAIGVLVAIFYGLSAIACATYYRNEDRGDLMLTLLRRVWPVLAALFVFGVAIAQVATAGPRANTIVFGLLLAGIGPMLYYRSRYKSAYYTEGKTWTD